MTPPAVPNAEVTAVADAIKLVPVEDITGDQARWAAVGEAGDYELYVRWPVVPGASASAPLACLFLLFLVIFWSFGYDVRT